jgi:CheY-like chemotaxis protein
MVQDRGERLRLRLIARIDDGHPALREAGRFGPCGLVKPRIRVRAVTEIGARPGPEIPASPPKGTPIMIGSSAAKGSPGHAGRRVLVVDDDVRVRTVVSWQLEADGFRVAEAPDGQRALEGIERFRPDLVVLDLSLPGVGGLDVLRRVRDAERAAGSAALSVIVLSGRDGETDRIIGLDFGADDYLVRPFSPGELVARVRSVLRGAGSAATSPGAAPDGVAEG